MAGSRPSSPVGGVALVVLAAGAGTRMKSALPKPLHPLAGIPMIQHVLRAGAAAEPVSTTLVVAPGMTDLAARLDPSGTIGVIVQDPPLGTGDAVKQALPAVASAEWILVLYGDHPLLTAETTRRLVAVARGSRAVVTILTCLLSGGGSYGRVERDRAGRPVRIVEQAADDPAARAGDVEINSGMMVLGAAWAKRALDRLTPNPIRRQYFLTDLVELAAGDSPVRADWPVATIVGEPDLVTGVNDRLELARAETILRDRIRQRHLLNGVTIVSPATVVIDEDVAIDQDTTILPFSFIQTGTTIGARCEIGPQTTLREAVIGDDVVVRASTVTRSSIASGSDVGPYAHLRGGTNVGPGVHIGNYAELKNATIERGAKVGHFGYLGDARVGAGTNIGAGTVTCNYDGVAKHRTEIGPGAFVGSDAMLVAPITIGAGARIGAGSVVTRDVPEGATVVGVPARAIKGRTPPADPTPVPPAGTESGR